MSYIHGITTQSAAYPISASQMTQWFGQRIPDAVARRKFSFLSRESAIDTKYSVLPDFSSDQAAILFKPGHSPSTEDRMQVYAEASVGLATQVCRQLLQQQTLSTAAITHLITVSCTGMFAPGLDIALVQQLGLSPETERYSVNFMGCYAAFTAMKMADNICRATPGSRVLVCCVELCTLHFRDDLSDDNLLSTILFGDGACAMLVASEPTEGLQLKIERFYANLIPQTGDLMGWYIGNQGFEMVLSSQIPQQIERHISSSYHKLLAQAGCPQADYFAIHPGGKNILTAFAKALQLPEDSLEHSFAVL
ncbi:MAG TPA: type III polyketide synthase, partial [Microscillaceae bacterium]|nr:type III polyketide synthase [Microscillaceae bacterium]